MSLIDANSRSPLKNRPLRNAGQSLDEQIHDFIETHIGGPLLLAVFAIVLAGFEWWRYYHPSPPSPGVYSSGAVLVIIYAVFRVSRSLPRVRALKLGRDGEKAVGHFLEGSENAAIAFFTTLPVKVLTLTTC